MRFAISLILMLTWSGHAFAQSDDEPTVTSFESQVDLSKLETIAVYREGRVKTYASFAREMMNFVTGRRTIDDQSRSFTYLDMMLREQRYADEPSIYIKSKLLRADITRALRDSFERAAAMHVSAEGESRDAFERRLDELRAELTAELEAVMDTGLIPEPMLFDPSVRAVLDEAEKDILRGARFVQMIHTAVVVKDPRTLREALRVVPPTGDDPSRPWISIDQLAMETARRNDPVAVQVVAQWDALQLAWARSDAAGVNAAADQLAELLPQMNAALYPDMSRLSWESWYFRMKNMTWVWLVYALGLIPLILHLVFRWSGARWVGLLIFALAFGLHTFAIMLRWYVAQRWPNSNMFEAITTAAWFGGCCALLLEIFLRRTPMRGLFALVSAGTSGVALMAVHFDPLELGLDPNIGNMMPVLHDLWLYIHTNVIIFSYCLIGMAAISAGLYLLLRLYGWLSDNDSFRGYARVGGAGSLIVTTPTGESVMQKAGTNISQVLDGTTMILLEMSFILLWAGIVMGAIWADHSWGRPWGWDPKEVFALNTFIIFALLVHTRLKVKDKGLWTAILAVIGCAVMIFNWIVINFTIAGLHSYA